MRPRKEEYRAMVERGDGVYHYSSTFSEGKTRREISFLFAVVQGYEGYDWLFAANIRLDDVRVYVHIYKGQVGDRDCLQGRRTR